MKIYLHEQGIIMTGKAWEIQHKLAEYRKQYKLVSQWIEGDRQTLPPGKK